MPGLPLSVNSHSAIFHGDAAHIGSIKNDDPRFEWNPLFRVQRSGMPPLRNYLAVEAEEEVGPITLHDKPLGGSGFALHGYVFPFVAVARGDSHETRGAGAKAK